MRPLGVMLICKVIMTHPPLWLHWYRIAELAVLGNEWVLMLQSHSYVSCTVVWHTVTAVLNTYLGRYVLGIPY
ncbi:hypothetical protein SPHINGO8AM_130021 [Sphingomonas sp. 8AM]|nr:hypothetical protein SPHINGO8AM_130021 [Sphingomonas sp. 8AM]